MVFEKAGFEVVSASSFRMAFDLCRAGNFDLLIIGHSIPPADKEKLIISVRRACGAPVLAIRYNSEPPVPGADYCVDGLEGPKVLLEAVHEALAKTDEKKSSGQSAG
jgi:hypothetical protein